MTDRLDNPPAFTNAEDHRVASDLEWTQGMTLRDYFAAKAMQASRSRRSVYKTWDDLAADSYDIADAMLAVRQQTQGATDENQ